MPRSEGWRAARPPPNTSLLVAFYAREKRLLGVKLRKTLRFGWAPAVVSGAGAMTLAHTSAASVARQTQAL